MGAAGFSDTVLCYTASHTMCHVSCSQSCCITCVVDMALYSNLNYELRNKVLLNEVALCYIVRCVEPHLHRIQMAVECIPRLEVRVVCLCV